MPTKTLSKVMESVLLPLSSNNELSSSQLNKMLDEALEDELNLKDTEEERRRLRTRLALEAKQAKVEFQRLFPRGFFLHAE
jgi:hypothetical protein